jgi:uncharacterized protein
MMNQNIPNHTIPQTIALHLVPGTLITAFYFLTAPLVIHAGYPALMSLLLAILFILIPFELGFLLYQGYQQNGRLSLKNVVLYREPIISSKASSLGFQCGRFPRRSRTALLNLLNPLC